MPHEKPETTVHRLSPEQRKLLIAAAPLLFWKADRIQRTREARSFTPPWWVSALGAVVEMCFALVPLTMFVLGLLAGLLIAHGVR